MNKFLIGFTTGILVGLLFAPARGSETLENLSRTGRDLKRKFNDLVDAVTDKFESMKSDVDEFTVSQRADSFKNEMI